MRSIASISVAAVLVCGCATTAGHEKAGLQIPTQWKPSHPQNGSSVVAVVRVFATVQKPYKDQRTGRQVFQSKGRILKVDGATGQRVPSGLWSYLLYSKPLKNDSVLTVEGTLTISEAQIKGGEYPATIRVDEQMKKDSSH